MCRSLEKRQNMYLKTIACEVAWREISFVAARSPHMVDLEFLPVGLHDEPKQGQRELQARIDSVPAGKYDAILVGYGMCNQMLTGLTTPHTPLVVPRAHDCLTFFLGSKERYRKVFTECPGTYYFTAGWLEFPQRRARAQGSPAGPLEVGAQTSPFALGKSYADLVAKYGEENAQYLLEVSQRWTQSYQRALLIRFDFDQGLGLQEKVGEICRNHGWQCAEIAGDLSLLKRWVDGQWDAGEFLIVQPGETVHPTYDDGIVQARKMD
jgi:hypothetical protein